MPPFRLQKYIIFLISPNYYAIICISGSKNRRFILLFHFLFVPLHRENDNRYPPPHFRLATSETALRRKLSANTAFWFLWDWKGASCVHFFRYYKPN